MNSLIGLIYFLILLTSIVITKFRYNKYLLPNTVFTLIWTFIIILSLIIDIGIIRPGVKIYIYGILAIITFNSVYFFCTKKHHLIRREKPIPNKTFKLNNRAIVLIEIIALMLISPNLFASLQEILSNGFDLANLRNQTYIEARYDSHVLTFLFRSVPMAMFTVIMLIAINNLVNGKKKFLYFMLINLLIEIITFGGRGKLWNFVAFFIGATITSNRLKGLNFKQKKYLLYAISGLVIVTILRGDDLLNVAKTAYLYFVGPFSYLELILQNPGKFGLDQPLMFGYMTLGFVFEPLALMLKALIGVNIDVPSYYFNIFGQNFVNIGTSDFIFYNNNTTMLYTFIRDFGIYGIVIGTAIVTFLICYFQKRAIKFDNLKYQLLLIFMYSVIFDSARVYMLTNTNLFIIFFTLSFVIYKSEKNAINESK